MKAFIDTALTVLVTAIVLGLVYFLFWGRTRATIPAPIPEEERYFMPFNFIDVFEPDEDNYHLLHVFIPVKAGYKLVPRDKKKMAIDSIHYNVIDTINCTLDYEILKSRSVVPKLYHESILIDKTYYQKDSTIIVTFKNLKSVYDRVNPLPDFSPFGCPDLDHYTTFWPRHGDKFTFPDPICEIPIPPPGGSK